LDGLYDFWIHDGDILVTVALYGYETQTMSIHVTPGSETELNFNMLSYGMPVPELDSSVTPILFTAIVVFVTSRKIVGFLLSNRLTFSRGMDADQIVMSFRSPQPSIAGSTFLIGCIIGKKGVAAYTPQSC